MPPKGFDPQDPMELVGMVVPGEPGTLDAMAETIVEEFVRLGWNEKRLMTLFTNPMFLAPHRVYKARGEDYVKDLIQKIRAKWSL